MALAHPRRPLEATIGLAFLSKKLPRVLTPEVRRLAVASGLRLVPLDPHRALDAQAAEAAQSQAEPADNGDGAALTAASSAFDRGEASTDAPFDMILHKIPADPVWETHLGRYVALHHPRVLVLDPPGAVHATEDRVTMLAAIPPSGLRLRLPDAGPCALPQPSSEQQQQHPQDHGKLGPGNGSSCGGDVVVGGGEAGYRSGAGGEFVVAVRAPAQAVLRNREELRRLAAAGAAAEVGGEGDRPAGLQPPLILKPQRADAAGGGGHALAVALSWAELADRAGELQHAAAAAAAAAGVAATTATATRGFGHGEAEGGGGDPSGWVPLVVQQYVPHTDALYKVYVLGEHVQVERRASLTLPQLAALHSPTTAATASATCRRDSSGLGSSAPVPPPPQAALLKHLSVQPLQPRALQGGAVVASASAPVEDRAGEAPPGLTPSTREALVATEAAALGPGRVGCCAPSGVGSGGVLDERVLGAVAQELSRRTGLTMFNFDVVAPVPDWDPDEGPRRAAQSTAADAEVPSRGAEEGATAGGGGSRALYVVDVNYFPGYDKLSGWEAQLVGHLRAAAEELRRAVPLPMRPHHLT